MPVAVTLSLLLVARKMARNKVLVKSLSVIETLSCVNVIASDKTGTLTQNKMFVTTACAGLTIVNSKQARRASTMGDTKAELKSSLQLLNACILCNEAKFDDQDMMMEGGMMSSSGVVLGGTSITPGADRHSLGSRRDSVKPVNERPASGGATDVAILRYGANYLEMDEVYENYEVLDKLVGVLPFNSRNKWMARIFKKSAQSSSQEPGDCFNLGEDECVITMKGAPDILITSCKWIMRDDGTQAPLDSHALERLKQIQTEWCLLGQRVLLICKKNESVSRMLAFGSQPASDLEAYLKEMKDLCVLGMVGIIDKPRDGIETVIKTCRQAGVRVFMVN